jgi:hypothetical protein
MRAGGFVIPKQWGDVRGNASARTQAGVTLNSRRSTWLAARDLAKHAAQLNSGDPLTETMLAAAYCLAHDVATAALHADRALALDGGSAWPGAAAAGSKATLVRQAKRLSVCKSPWRSAADPMNFLCSVGIAAGHFSAARYDKSAWWFERAPAERAQLRSGSTTLDASYVLAGHEEHARRSLRELRAFPDLQIAQIGAGLPFRSDYLTRCGGARERGHAPALRLPMSNAHA